MHIEVSQWCEYVRQRFPQYFIGKKVLDVGSLDINGNNRYLFHDCVYVGLDIGEGPNVNIVSVTHECQEPDESYDTIISTEVFEHDMFYAKTLQKIVKMLKPGGMFFFTCASEGRGEHGTINSDVASSPLTCGKEGWNSYYKNLVEADIREAINVDEIFSSYEFNVVEGSLKDWGKDIRFWGIKK